METKNCENCGRGFPRPQSFSASKWAAMRFCSVTCANRARALPLRRRGSETKPCENCGSDMAWPANYAERQWREKRFCSRACAGAAVRAATDQRKPLRRCTICGEEFRSPHASQRTCAREECQAEHRRTISGPAAGERMKADYAAGRRKKVEGVSPRERALWPILMPLGWTWRLAWTDTWGSFELDFSRQDLMLNVEIDGVEHRQPRRRVVDEARDAELVRRGWRILRIPNEDVDASPDAVAQRFTAWAAG